MRAVKTIETLRKAIIAQIEFNSCVIEENSLLLEMIMELKEKVSEFEIPQSYVEHLKIRENLSARADSWVRQVGETSWFK